MITGTLTNRTSSCDWSLIIDDGCISTLTAPDPRDPMVSATEILIALGDALKPIVTHEGLDDLQIIVQLHDGRMLGSLIVKDGIIAPRVNP